MYACMISKLGVVSHKVSHISIGFSIYRKSEDESNLAQKRSSTDSNSAKKRKRRLIENGKV